MPAMGPEHAPRRLELNPYGMPDGLCLQKSQHSPSIRRSVPVRLLCRGVQNALDIGHRGPLEVAHKFLRGTREVKGIDVAVSREHRRKLGGATGEQVDNP